jgi:hypothetical protein
MILLVHLLQHLGVPSGTAIAVVIAVKKFLRDAGAKIGTRRDRGRGQRSIRGYR